MIIINTLASAGLDQLPDGEWKLHSRFSQAINFCYPGGELLTLFRYGKGMGPAGVLMNTEQFQRVDNVTRIIKQGNTLRAQNIIIRSRRVLRLQLPAGAFTPVDLSFYTHQSGLVGALNQPLDIMPLYPEIIAQLEYWHHGAVPDWHWLIGRGPGLTPSGDDMLTGMIAVLHACGIFTQQPSFLPPKDRLAQLTTSVSCSYLNSARIGEFSTPVLRVIRSLQSGRDPHSAICRLLAVGHTSGADIVLGIAIAQRWLQVSDSRRRHARSGNNTHVYSGC